MYNGYFGLAEAPFSITPDPRYLFMSQRHREALAHLLYGIHESGGFVVLTGEVGTGKTTVTRALLEQMPENVDVALILNPCLTVAEFLACVCDELGVTYPEGNRSIKVFVDQINAFLLDKYAQGRRVVVVVDEAQNLNPAVLEQVRLLTNLETTKEKLLQIILVGQPELNDLLARSELRQLSQRITARYHLKPLTPFEVSRYVAHRLRIAGCRQSVFSSRALRAIWRLSGGIPRVVNVICDRALLGAYAADRLRVRTRMVRQAAREVMGEVSATPRKTVSAWQMGVVVTVALTALIALAWFAPSWSWRQWMPQSAVLTTSSEELVDWLGSRTPRPEVKAETLQQWLREWAVPAEGVRDCEALRAQGWRCQFGLAEWAKVIEWNRMLLLTLRMGESQYTVLLQNIDGERVTLGMGSHTKMTSRAEVEAIWTGEYTDIWKSLDGYTTPLRMGSKGEIVKQLRIQLARVMAQPALAATTADDIFDQTLVDAVKRFQTQQGLIPDGLVGEETLYRMFHNDPKVVVPRLF
jgi:general secretion pathway protein A